MIIIIMIRISTIKCLSFNVATHLNSAFLSLFCFSFAFLTLYKLLKAAKRKITLSYKNILLLEYKSTQDGVNSTIYNTRHFTSHSILS